MASTYILTSDAYDGRYLQLSCNQTMDITSNTSLISWTLSSLGGNTNYYSVGPTAVTVNGTQVYYCERKEWDSQEFPAAKGSVNGTISIPHDTSGNKSITLSLRTVVYNGAGSAETYSGTWTLDSIPRQAMLTSAPNFNDTQVPKITYSNPLGESAEELKICIADSSATVVYAPYRDVSKAGSEYTFGASDVDILKQKTVNSLDIAYVLRTKISGKYYYSTLYRKFTMTEHNGTKPSISASVTVNNDGLPSAFAGMCIQGKSRLDINITGQGKYGAQIVRYAAVVDNNRYTGDTITSAPLQTAGAVNVVVSAIDSRGFTTSASYEVNVTAYSAPVITSFTAERQSNGTSVTCRIKGSVTPLDSNNTKDISITIGGVTTSVHASGYTINNTITFNGLPTDETLIATARIADAFSAVTKEATVPTVDATMDFHASGKGVAFGKVAEHADLLDINWDVQIKGDKISDFVIARGTSGVWAYEKWASGVIKFWGSKTYDSLSITAAWSRGYYKDLTDFGALPSGMLAADAPRIILPSIKGNDLLFIMVRTDDPTFRVCALDPTTTSSPNTIDCLIISRWK